MKTTIAMLFAFSSVTLLAGADRPGDAVRREQERFQGHNLWKLQTKLNVHPRFPVTAMAFSPDGQTMATAFRGEQPNLILWQLPQGREKTRIDTHIKVISAIAFSPDGRRVASSGWDGIVRLWDATTGKAQSTLRGHTSYVLSLAFSPDCKALATASNDKTVKLWDPSTSKQLATLKGHDEHVYAVAFSPDGKLLATGGKDRSIVLWDVDKRESRALLRGHTDSIQCLAFSPDGKLLVSGAGAGMGKPDVYPVRIWEVAGEQCIAGLQHAFWVRTLAFSPDGLLLATGGPGGSDGRGQARIWKSGYPWQEFPALPNLEKGRVAAVAFSPDGRLFAVAQGGTVRFWQVQAKDAARREQERFQGTWKLVAVKTKLGPDDVIERRGKDWVVGPGLEAVRRHAVDGVSFVFKDGELTVKNPEKMPRPSCSGPANTRSSSTPL